MSVVAAPSHAGSASRSRTARLFLRNKVMMAGAIWIALVALALLRDSRHLQIIALVITFAAIGAAASIQAADFYLQLQRPTWAPPAWLFGPVWSTLYFLMAIAAWLVWRKHLFGANGGTARMEIEWVRGRAAVDRAITLPGG